ncbi:alpha/beta fold hydrolase [Kytococcus sedentarius]|uniref:alpha/beta fold hydrolase n=1 Tax=Kytococcus sedentarius TaxID=1276 RepID=UPI0038502305
MTASPSPHVVRRGSGLPVVALHGNGVDHRLLAALDPALEAVGGLERIYLDLPGFGQTPSLPAAAGGLPELAAWTVEAVRTLTAGSPFALLANSLGGLLARHVRRELGDRVVGMALLAPVVHPEATKRTVPGLEVVDRDDDLLAGLDDADREQFTAMGARLVPAAWERFATSALPGIRAADKRAMVHLSRRYALPQEPEAGLPPFTGPTLVVTGAQDHVVGHADQLELVRRHYPSATYAVLHGAGHNVHVDCPRPVEELVGHWAGDLSRVTAR